MAAKRNSRNQNTASAKLPLGPMLLSFVVGAFVMFLVVKAMNTMKKKEAAAPATPPEPTTSEKLLAEIRDLLKK